MKSILNQFVHKDLITQLSPEQINATSLPFESLLNQCFPMLTEDARRHFVTQWTLERIQQVAEHGCILVIEDLKGLLICSEAEGGVGTLFWLMVLPEWRFKGLGHQLLDQMDAFYTQVSAHKIKVTAPTSEARDYYLAKGFMQEGFHPNHWWNLDFWSLAKAL